MSTIRNNKSNVCAKHKSSRKASINGTKFDVFGSKHIWHFSCIFTDILVKFLHLICTNSTQTHSSNFAEFLLTILCDKIFLTCCMYFHEHKNFRLYHDSMKYHTDQSLPHNCLLNYPFGLFPLFWIIETYRRHSDKTFNTSYLSPNMHFFAHSSHPNFVGKPN